jgi:hypothetical protein
MNGTLFVFKLCVCVCVRAAERERGGSASFVTFRKESVITEPKKHFREDLILPELLADNLSDVLEDIFQ